MARVYDRYLKQRLSRRRLLAATGGTALGAAALAACGGGNGGGGETGTPAVDEGEPQFGGILKQRQTAAYPNFNVFGPGISALQAGLFMGFTVYDHLWYVPTDTGETIKFLADDIETIDSETIRVTLGEGFFHDKPPVNARRVLSSDVKASLEKFRSQIPFGFSWSQEVFERMDTPDDQTVVYHQNRPWTWFFTASNAGSPISSSILPEEVLDNDDILQNDPIGSGRWMMASPGTFTNVKLRKFENYREAPLPYIDGIDYVFIPDDIQAQAQFSAQNIDSIGGLNNEEQAALITSFGDRLFTSSDLSRSYRTLMIKNIPPFDDPQVRHGINLLLNRQEIMQVMNLGDGEFSGPIPPAHELFVLDDDDPDLQEYFRHDIADGKLMLEGAGFDFDQEITIKYSNLDPSPQLAQILAQQLREGGLNINLPGAQDLVAWLTNTLTADGDFQMTCFTHLPYEDPYLPMSFYLGTSTSGQGNAMAYQDDEVDAAILGAASEEDEEARVEATKDVQRLLINKWAPMLNLYSPVTFGARWDHYKGVISGRGSFGLFNAASWLEQDNA